jgi:hypothetical protein
MCVDDSFCFSFSCIARELTGRAGKDLALFSAFIEIVLPKFRVHYSDVPLDLTIILEFLLREYS